MDEVTDRKRSFLKLIALGVILIGGFLAVRVTPLGDVLSRDGVSSAIELLRGSAWAPIIFIAAYAGLTALAVPGTILTLVGGGVFGVFWGTVYNSIAANIGANAAFLISRALGRDGVRGLLGSDSTALEKLDDVVGRHGFRGLLTLRLIPLVPFNALNFGSGLLPLRWRTYAVATLVGIFPGTLVYTFFADALLQGSQEASRGALIRVLIAGVLLILMSFLPQILKRFRISVPGAAAGVLFGLLSWPGGALGQTRGAEPVLPDHGGFTMLLEAVVVPEGVDYSGLKARHGDLEAYLGRLASVADADLGAASQAERLAFWINAYNACMLDRVVRHYPIERAGGLARLKNAVAGRPTNSVWQISDVFTEAHCAVAGADRSQDEIEHEIIRPMGDPRIHFAINCAAVSCPPLVAEAYTGAELEDQLDERVRAFMADTAHYRLDGGTLQVNKVLDWFGSDFGGPEGLKAFFGQYASGPEKEMLEDPDTEVTYFEYDWTLNDAR
ncbi:MAG: DUF547 domain-containing protein [Gemmatimonadetes bacterium]|nr:DUF547 domain-containing protein [Gemmatimonadota bacterium]